MNNLKDTIMLTAGIIILVIVCVFVACVAMTLYFELTNWAWNIKLRWTRRRHYVRAANLRREDIALKQAWDAYSANIQNATIGDRLEFYARMRESS